MIYNYKQLAIFKGVVLELFVNRGGEMKPVFGIQSIMKQVRKTYELFPEIKPMSQNLLIQISGNERSHFIDSKRWHAIPNWINMWGSYPEACEKMLTLLEETYSGRFKNYRENGFCENLRESEKKQRMMQILRANQKNADILLLPVQLGENCPDRTILSEHEFEIGFYEAAFMLLIDPERLQGNGDLGIALTGDSFKTHVGSFPRAPVLRFENGKLTVGTHCILHIHEGCGFATALLI